jgi:8-oxo-dGTP pyrophosphatase MutT (NUDIX family)
MVQKSCCCGIILNTQGHVLLVLKDTKWKQQWILPGGKPEEADNWDNIKTLVRELREECKIAIETTEENIELGWQIEWVNFSWDSYNFTWYRIHQRVDSITIGNDENEIIRGEFFDPDNLPENTSPPTREIIKQAFTQ